MLKEVFNKLKVKDGMHLLILNAPEDYLALSDEIPISISIEEVATTKKYPFVQLFAGNQRELGIWGKEAVQSLEENGVLWICYPKKTSPLYEDLSRDEGWDMITSCGFEGVSLISVNDTWSSMRFRPKNASSKGKNRPAPSVSEEAGKREEAVMPEELRTKLAHEPEAAAFFEGLADSYKKVYLEWVTGAKREETKNKRMNEMVEKLKRGFKNPYAK